MTDQTDIPGLLDRQALPDALRVLLSDYPRDAWEANPRFSGLVRFWLDRHLMFRKLTEMLIADGQAVLDNQMDFATYAPRLSRFGGMLLNQLHGHHQIEDAHYFPILAGLDKRLIRGFDMLDRDHQAMDGLLNRFATGANDVLGQDADGFRDRAAGFLREVDGFTRLLDRHLNDEEDLVVPVILNNPEAGLE